ncbi:hypothetical protein EJ04DRAFT_566214 [Polyplosphaeria fusca]|uniref:Heterokaryon incompatibility domain-containing protein n=1 Tax=Polyplosphaeria fusca TaxID=682080 RepID=A0A9P4QT59_9PLEO|nr:hypothetical protein EJ04DRAFT_566214 [Polyplosphaeria fusca]
MPITYRPLKGSGKEVEIRLLELEPAPQLTYPLRAKLRHIKLHEANYAALSYIWGEKKAKRGNIEILYKTKKKRFGISSSTYIYDHITGNSLTRALKHLRYHRDKITTWIDALCINQDDDKEKSWHIPLMGSIYSMAAKVHAWLGPNLNDESTDTNTAFELADEFWSLAQGIQSTRIPLHENNWLEAYLAMASPQLSSDEA